MEIEIVYEDTDFLAINKPSGMLVHPDGVSKEKTVIDWILEKYPNIAEVGEPETLKNGEIIKRPGIVHRLDKDTSGVLLICKTKESYDYLKKQFSDKKVKKEYHALVYGKVNQKEFTVNEPIGRHPTDFRRRLAHKNARGAIREATTNFETIKTADSASFIYAYPLTGRTHQIRVHLKLINHPVVCDPLYAPKQPCLFGIDRLALHAYKISWNGLSGTENTAIAQYPEDFKNAVDSFEHDIA